MRISCDRYWVYILECTDGSLYTGITTDLERRLAEHRRGEGGRYTRAKGALRMVYTEACADKSSALRREHEIKSWGRRKKLALIDA